MMEGWQGGRGEDYSDGHHRVLLKQQRNEEGGCCTYGSKWERNNEQQQISVAVATTTPSVAALLASSRYCPCRRPSLQSHRPTLPLRTVCSISYFESTTIDTFRNNLIYAIQNELLLHNNQRRSKEEGDNARNRQQDAATQGNFLRYDPIRLKNTILQEINWMELCHDHNKGFLIRRRKHSGTSSISSSSSTTTTTTTTFSALQEIVQHLLNPCIVPKACHCNLLQVWFHILLTTSIRKTSHHKKKRKRHDRHHHHDDEQNVDDDIIDTCWTSSELVLLQSIIQLVVTNYDDSILSIFQWSHLKQYLIPPSSQQQQQQAEQQHGDNNPFSLGFDYDYHDSWHRVLSIFHYVAQDDTLRRRRMVKNSSNFYSSIVTTIVCMIQQLDDTDISNLNSSNYMDNFDDDDDFNCLQCRKIELLEQLNEKNGIKKLARNAGRGTTDETVLGMLHDEETIGSTTYVPNSKRARFGQSSCRGVSYQQVLRHQPSVLSDRRESKQNQSKCCPNCGNALTNAPNSKKASTLPKKWKMVQFLAIEIFVSIAKLMTAGAWNSVVSTSISKSMNDKYRRRRTLLSTTDTYLNHAIPEFLAHMASQQYASPSLRLCLLLWTASSFQQSSMVSSSQHDDDDGRRLSTSQEHNYYDFVSKRYWKNFVTTKNSIRLRLYTEWIVECAYYDNDVACRSVIVPMVEYILKQHQQEQEQQRHHCKKNTDGAIDGRMFSCLAYLFASRRGHLFLDQSMRAPESEQSKRSDYSSKDDESLFPAFISMLSSNYSDRKYWLQSGMSQLDQERVIRMLQLMRILKANDDEHSVEEPNANEEWQFDEVLEAEVADGVIKQSATDEDANNESWEFDEVLEECDGEEVEYSSNDMHGSQDTVQNDDEGSGWDFDEILESDTESAKDEADEDVVMDANQIHTESDKTTKNVDDDNLDKLVTSESPVTPQLDDDAIECWPFAASNSLRSAFMRMKHNSVMARNSKYNDTGILPDGSDLLSNIAFEDKLSNRLGDSCDSSTVSTPGVPIMDYLQTDLVQILFSFCGFKRLVKLREVCKTWKDISDSSDWLWYSAYKSRFGLLPQDPHATSRSKHDWKELFRAKWLAEKNLRFRRNHGSGWKYRTCQYIGCLAIVKSAKMQKQHYESHVRKEHRQREHAERLRLRKQKKEAQRKLQDEERRKKLKVATIVAEPSPEELKELEYLLEEWDHEEQEQRAEAEAWLEQQDINDLATFLEDQYG